MVDAATIAGDTLELIVSELESAVERDEPLYKLLSLLKNEDRYELIKQVIDPKFGNFVVAPKEVDSIIDDIASVVANGINIALHPGSNSRISTDTYSPPPAAPLKLDVVFG